MRAVLLLVPLLAACATAPATMPTHASLGYAFGVDLGAEGELSGLRLTGEVPSLSTESTSVFAAIGLNSYEVDDQEVKGTHIEIATGVKRWWGMGPLLTNFGLEVGAGAIVDVNGDDGHLDVALFAGPVAGVRIPIGGGVTIDADVGYRWTAVTDRNLRQPADMQAGMSGTWAILALGFDF